MQISLLMVCVQANASNDDKFHRFDIPSRSLFESLGTISKTTGKTSLFVYSLVESKTAKPLKGYYTAQQALDVLLSGTGLIGEVTNEDTFIIKQSPKSIEDLDKRAKKNESSDKVISSQPSLSAKKEYEIEVINIVSGFSASEVEAINMKKFANTISANLSAEDIGVLPDQSIAESLQRLTGVTGNQNDGRSDTINVRGLGSAFTLITLNGREIVSSFGARSINLSLFPSEAIRKAQVFKTAMADSLEGGIGGTVNMETIRPLALNKDIRTFSATVNGNTNFDGVNIGDKYGKKLSGMFSHHFSDELAIAIGAAYRDEPLLLENYKQSQLQPWIDFDGDGEGDLGPSSHGFITKKQDITHTSLFATGQWQATQKLLITADTLVSDYEYEQFTSNTIFTLWDGFQPVIGSTRFDDNNNVMASIGSTNGITAAPSYMVNKDSTAVYGLNFAYTINENLQLDVDISGSTSDRNYNWRGSYDTFGAGIKHHISWDNTTTRPQFIYHGSDINDDGKLSNILNDSQYHDFTNIVNNDDEVISTNTAIKADLTFEADFDFFQQFKVGFRASQNEKELLINSQHLTLDDMPGLAPSDYQQTIIDTGHSSFDGIKGLDQPYFFNLAELFSDHGDTFPENIQDAKDRAESYDLIEDTLSLYAQTSFATDWFDGTIGIRYYKTELETTSEQVQVKIKKLDWQNQEQDVYEMFWPEEGELTGIPTVASNEYSDFLPTLNVNFRMIDDVVIRLGLGKAMIRPTVSALNNGVAIKRWLNDGKTFGDAWDAGDENSSLGSIGNANLKPITSKQADISFEYYPNSTDYYALAIFYKDLDALYVGGADHFVVEGSVDEEGNPVALPLNQLIMGEGGSVNGIEISFRQNMAFVADFLTGLSISGNYMKFNNQAEQDYNPQGANPWDPDDDRFQELMYRPAGWIDETWNLTFTYDISQKFSARYNINQQSDMVLGDYREYRLRLPSTMHSMSLRYKHNSSLTIFGQVNNLTDEYVRSGQIHLKFHDKPQKHVLHEQQYQGTSYYIGASVSF